MKRTSKDGIDGLPVRSRAEKRHARTVRSPLGKKGRQKQYLAQWNRASDERKKGA